jgi:hypothetical protein
MTSIATAPASSIDPRMGAFVWWDLDQTKCTPAHLRRVLAAEGIEINVPDIEAISGIRRACQQWGVGRGNADRFRAEVTAVETDTIYVGILQHQREGSREVAWKQRELLAYDLTAKAWKNAAPSDEAVAFMGIADDFMAHHDHKWIRPNILQPELAAMKAVMLKRQGGFYFVALAHMDRVRRLKRIVAALGNSALNVVTVENDEDSREAVANGTREHVLGQIAEVREQLTEWRASTRKIRTDSQANVLGQLAELLDVAGLYETTLEVSLADLRAEVDACRTEALAIIAAQ